LKDGCHSFIMTHCGRAEIGKVLIENDYPFALIKYLDKNFSEKSEFNTKEASIKIRKPDWIKS